MTNKAKLKTYQGMWFLTAIFSLVLFCPSIKQYLNEGGFNSPKVPVYLVGKEAIFLLSALGGMALVSVIGFFICSYKLKNENRSNQRMKTDEK